jgi:NAD(P)-dependent dehydrogenase (short-subunit alcohol dehydrogenase family)
MNKEIIDMFSLDGKTAVITGGAGVIGSHLALGLGRAGAKIVITDIGPTDEVVEKAKKEGIEAYGYYMDVMNPDKLKDATDKIMSDMGRVDILINCAGGNMAAATTSKDVSFFDLPFDALQKVVALNLFGGAILPAQTFGRYMAKNPEGASIINISSMNAFRPLTRIPGYSAAKAAVSNFTQWLAVHFAQEYNKKLRVNAIAPGFLSTKQNRYLLYNEDGTLSDRGKTIVAHTPMGRFGEPDELIGVVVWLASDAASFVTGIVVPIDGGFNAFSGV